MCFPTNQRQKVSEEWVLLRIDFQQELAGRSLESWFKQINIQSYCGR